MAWKQLDSVDILRAIAISLYWNKNNDILESSLINYKYKDIYTETKKKRKDSKTVLTDFWLLNIFFILYSFASETKKVKIFIFNFVIIYGIS